MDAKERAKLNEIWDKLGTVLKYQKRVEDFIKEDRKTDVEVVLMLSYQVLNAVMIDLKSLLKKS
ncbi:MAG: hypothetical protein AABX55_03240 [Nanoarchaeota archaeon]